MVGRFLLGLVAVSLGACDGGGGTDAGTDAGAIDAGPATDADPGTDASPGTDAGMAMSIPGPGAFTDRWTIDGLEIGPGHGTPETAFQVGTVSRNPDYIGATLDAVTGDAYWVFQTAPAMTTIEIALRGDVTAIDFMHLHDGAGMVFGAEIPTVTYSVMPFEILGSWAVTPSHVYVLEIHGSMGTFF